MTDDIRRRMRMERRYALLALMIGFWLTGVVVQTLTGGSFAGSSSYNSYTLQAMAWRDGMVSLGRDYPHLELAVYNNDWYVSFPPVPSIPMYFLTFFFGVSTPDALVVKIYAFAAALAVYCALVNSRWRGWPAAGLAFLMTLGGSMLPLIANGAVWYQAQTMAFMLTTASAALMTGGCMTGSLFLYALAVGCRPFNVCYGPLLMIVWFMNKPERTLEEAGRKLGKGIALGLCVAAAYAAYNYARFGNPLEFGHNYLPEFVRSATGQFSLSHIVKNAKRFLIGLPLYGTEDGFAFEKFGCSIFLGNPVLLLMMIRFVRDLFGRRMNLQKVLTIVFFAAHLFLLLLHRTGGGFQLGARYAVDLVPYSLIYLGLGREDRAVEQWEWAVLIAGFAFMLAGAHYVHI